MTNQNFQDKNTLSMRYVRFYSAYDNDGERTYQAEHSCFGCGVELDGGIRDKITDARYCVICADGMGIPVVSRKWSGGAK